MTEPTVRGTATTESGVDPRIAGSDGADQGEDYLPLDVVFDILKNRRRRLVLRYLHAESPTTTLSDLAEHIAALENDKPREALSSAERKRVYVCLYQCHLPKMDDAGIIEFQSERGSVELDNDTDQFAQYIDVKTAEDGSDWPRSLAGIATLGGAAFIAQWVLLSLDLLSGVFVAVVLGILVYFSLTHAFQRGLLRRDVTESESSSPAGVS